MEQSAVDAVLDDPVTRRLFERTELARMSYSARDGSPRVVPIGFVWRAPAFVVATVPNAAKVASLRHDPRVALTIDTEDFPPNVLLVRGSAELELVDGVPDEYVESTRKRLTAQEHAQWEAEVRRLFDQMVRIRITPTWAKILDFETRGPSAVEEIARRKAAADPQPSSSTVK